MTSSPSVLREHVSKLQVSASKSTRWPPESGKPRVCTLTLAIASRESQVARSRT